MITVVNLYGDLCVELIATIYMLLFIKLTFLVINILLTYSLYSTVIKAYLFGKLIQGCSRPILLL